MRDTLSKPCPFCGSFPEVITVARPGRPTMWRAQCRNLHCKATFSLGQISHDAALNHWDRRLLPEPLGDVPTVPCGACAGSGRKPLSEDHLILRGLLQSGGPSTVTKLQQLVVKRGLSQQMVNERLSQLEALGMVRRRKRDGRSFLWESYEKEERAADVDDDSQRMKSFTYAPSMTQEAVKMRIRSYLRHNRFKVIEWDIREHRGFWRGVAHVVAAEFPVVPVGRVIPEVALDELSSKT